MRYFPVILASISSDRVRVMLIHNQENYVRFLVVHAGWEILEVKTLKGMSKEMGLFKNLIVENPK